MNCLKSLPWRCFLALNCLVLSLAGCTRQDTLGIKPSMVNAGAGDGPEEQFKAAIELLASMQRLSIEQGKQQMLLQLNLWAKDAPPVNDWALDRLVQQTLPPRLKRLSAAGIYAKDDYEDQDSFALLVAYWLRGTVLKSAENPLAGLEPSLAKWLSQNEAQLDAAENKKLSQAMALFDWTMRNLQLRPAVDQKERFAGTPDAPQPDWQTLLLGTANATERARIFLLLCRQAEIDACAIQPNDEELAKQTPPLVAVLAGGHLYLFDPALALPLPGKDHRGIATLAQVAADDALLRQLDLAEAAYPLQAESLKQVAALINADLESLSSRMKRIEDQLSAKDKLILTIAPSRIEKKMRDLPGIARVGLWPVPFDTLMYLSQLNSDPKLLEKFNNSFFAMNQLSNLLINNGSPAFPLTRARMLHLRGDVLNDDYRYGANAMYLMCRPSVELLSGLSESAETQEKFGITPYLSADDAKRRKELADWHQCLVEGKQRASFWLGLSAYDFGNRFSVAAAHFKNWSLEPYPEGLFAFGARYNLARSLAAQNQFAEAAAVLKADQSPQKHGNLLLAKRYETLGKTEEKPAEKLPEAKPAAEKPVEKPAAEKPAKP